LRQVDEVANVAGGDVGEEAEIDLSLRGVQLGDLVFVIAHRFLLFGWLRRGSGRLGGRRLGRRRCRAFGLRASVLVVGGGAAHGQGEQRKGQQFPHTTSVVSRARIVVVPLHSCNGATFHGRARN